MATQRPMLAEWWLVRWWWCWTWENVYSKHELRRVVNLTNSDQFFIPRKFIFCYLGLKRLIDFAFPLMCSITYVQKLNRIIPLKYRSEMELDVKWGREDETKINEGRRRKKLTREWEGLEEQRKEQDVSGCILDTDTRNYGHAHAGKHTHTAKRHGRPENKT